MAIRATSLQLAAMFSICAAAACGGSSSGTPDASGIDDAAPAPDASPPTIADICGPDGVVPQLFARLLACNPAFDTLSTQGRLTISTETAFCNGALAPYVNDGSIAMWNAAQLQACVDYITNTPCLDLDFTLSSGPCDLLGSVADNGACEITDQCSAADYCVGAAPGGTCGACTARLTDGMPCTADEQCVNGACVGTQCGHKGVDNDPCVADNDCLGQRTCDTANHVCVTPRTWVVNDVCMTNGGNDCAPFTTGLYCKGNGNGTNGQCAPFIPLSGTCRTGGVVQGLCDVRQYQYCPAGADSTCTAPTTVTTEGMPCGMLQGLQCDATMACTNPLNNGTCVAYQQQGDTCTNNGAPTDSCDLFLQCFPGTSGNTCQYGDYSGSCP